MSSFPYIGEIMLAAFDFAPQGHALCDGQLLPISQHEALFALIGTTYGGDGESTFAMPDLRGRVPIGTGQHPTSSASYGLGDTGGIESLILGVLQTPAHTHAIDASGLTATIRVKNGPGTHLSPAGNVFAAEAPPPFTGATLTPGSDPIRAEHITELRGRIDTYRASVGLPGYAFADPMLTSGVTPVKAIHILDLRSALRQAYLQGGLTPPSYTDPGLTTGTTAAAVHISEIRDAVNAVTPVAPAYHQTPDSNMNAGAIALSASTTPATGGNAAHENRQPYLAINYCIALEGVFPPMS
jgi:microcystin-dependent protein